MYSFCWIGKKRWVVFGKTIWPAITLASRCMHVSMPFVPIYVRKSTESGFKFLAVQWLRVISLLPNVSSRRQTSHDLNEYCWPLLLKILKIYFQSVNLWGVQHIPRDIYSSQLLTNFVFGFWVRILGSITDNNDIQLLNHITESTETQVAKNQNSMPPIVASVSSPGVWTASSRPLKTEMLSCG